MHMDWKLRSYGEALAGRWGPKGLVTLALSMLLFTGILGGVLVRPTYGRWEVPYVLEPTETPSRSATEPRSQVVLTRTPATRWTLTPTSTPVPLPEEADVPILMYHYVSELPPDADAYRRDLTVSPQMFEAHLEYLDRADYHPITLTDLYLHLTEGYPLPEKPVVLTFDDGYRDAYEVVFTKLLHYGFPGTFFVLATPAHYESEAYLTWSQMKEMSDAGMDIQAHGRDHLDLRGRSYDFLVYQILGIKEAIEHHTGRVPRFFCYPSGQWDGDVIDVLESAGYWGAVTTQWGRTHKREDLYEMARLRMHGGESLESFIGKLEGE